MVIELVKDLGAWTWIILGVGLLCLEIAAPGAFFLWFGLAAIAVGALAFLVVVPWQAQVLLFVVLAAIVVVVGRRYFSRSQSPDMVSIGLNERGRRLVGTVVVLTEPIVDGKGSVRIDDTKWRVIGPSLPTGTRVRIVNAEGALLSVRPE
jgi:membrane protein implicated in regulation of membrane protease activity